MTISLFYGCCCVCIHTYPNHLYFYLLFGCSRSASSSPSLGLFFLWLLDPSFHTTVVTFLCRLKVAQRLRLEYPTGLHKDLLAH